MNAPNLEFKYKGNNKKESTNAITIEVENISLKARRELERLVESFVRSLDVPKNGNGSN
jgi:hypothetical protein